MSGPITKAHQCRGSVGKRERRKAAKDPLYIKALHDLPCPCCGSRNVIVHHILAGRHTRGVPVDGGQRSHVRDDRCAIPLCDPTHRYGHDVYGSVEVWLSDEYGIDAVALAVALRMAYRLGEPMADVIADFRMGRAA